MVRKGDEEEANFRALKAHVFNSLMEQHLMLDEKSSRRPLSEEDRKLFLDNVKIKRSEEGKFEITTGSFWKIEDEIKEAILQTALEEHLGLIELLHQSVREKNSQRPDCIPSPLSTEDLYEMRNPDPSVLALIRFQQRTERKHSHVKQIR